MLLGKNSFVRKLYVKYSDIISLLILLLVIWAIGFALFGNDIFGVNTQIFQLTILFVTAKISGWLVSLIKLPPMIGMLLMGVLLKNIQFIEITGGYKTFTKVLRQLALVNILLPAGLGLDPHALKKMSWMVLNLAVIPVAFEVVGVTIAAYFLLDFPWLWGVLLGLLLAAVSPAVIIPCLFQLQDMGYGVNKGIHTLVIAASTLNDIICIVFFGIVLGTIFSTESLGMQIAQGPIVLIIGFSFGLFWGFLCRIVPDKKEEYLVPLRILLLGFGCIFSALGSDAIGYGGAGSLGCIVAAFVASLGWRNEGWDNKNPVRLTFLLLWKFFEPISFGLIGIEVNFDILEPNTVLWCVISMSAPLLLRVFTSFIATQCTNFNVKEHLFVALSWIPKATVQATLGPAALDLAIDTGNEKLIGYANSVVIIAVLSIIITSPIGAILIMHLGPKLLHKTVQETKVTNGEDNSGFELESQNL